MRWRFGYALKSAVLADLYLTGFIQDCEGRARRVNSASHPDPLLDNALNRVEGRLWSEMITNDGRACREAVRDELEAAGWIVGRERRTFGIRPHRRQAVYDVDLVEASAVRVKEALRNILADRPADPRSLAVGLIGVQAQMPAVSSFNVNEQHRNALCEMTFAAIEPIFRLHQAIQNQFADMRSGMGGSGGCGGGGCGGGGCGGGT
jgi:Golgi phosphoprotein 3 (GPP34)